jgi:hypothetical protein
LRTIRRQAEPVDRVPEACEHHIIKMRGALIAKRLGFQA